MFFLFVVIIFSGWICCFIVSNDLFHQIIMRLPDVTEVSDELWDEVMDCLKLRMADKVPLIRTSVVRALSRFTNDSENSDILELFLQGLPLEQNAVSSMSSWLE